MGMWNRFAIALQVNLEERIRARIEELTAERARRLTELAQYDAALAELRALLVMPGEAERAAARARIAAEASTNPAAPPDLIPGDDGEPEREADEGEPFGSLVDRDSFMRP